MDTLEMIASLTLEELESDPYPLYAAMRSAAPVAYVPAAHQWLATRYEDVERIGNSPELFSSHLKNSPQEAAFGRPTILTVDGPVHLDLRAAVSPTLRPGRIRKTGPPLLEPIITRQLDELAVREQADLVADYFEPISLAVLGEVLGLGHIPGSTLKRWYRALSEGAANFGGDPGRASVCAAATAEIDAEVVPMMADPDRCPAGSIVSSLMVGGRPPGDVREIGAVLPTFKIILFAGLQEPVSGGATTVYGLLRNPRQLADVVNTPDELVPRAVQEGLRWINPVGTQTRETTQDVEIGGVVLPKGSMIGSALASANRDRAKFGESADDFDVHRDASPHVAFGVGLHHCAGNALATLQMTEAVRRLLHRFPNMRLDPTRPPVYHGWEFRSPLSLWVTLSPESGATD